MSDSKPKLRRGDPGYVGKGVTPENTRFKKNQVANPYGRRGKPRQDNRESGFDAEVSELILQDIRSKEGQCFRPSQIYLNAILKGVQKGHLPSIELYGALLAKASPERLPESVDEDTDSERQLLIDEALARRAARNQRNVEFGPGTAPLADNVEVNANGDGDE